jgi:RNA polymerase sigma-70 factor, ECF subfamily
MGGDEALAARARSGDLEAFRGLVEKHSHALFRLAFRLTGNEATAEDVVQETFLKAHRRLSSFDGRAQFSTWLYRIAVNTASDHRRGRSRQEGRWDPLEEPGTGGAELPSVAPDPERLARSGDIARAVRAAWPALSPLERAAFTLRHYEGHPVAEICRILEVGESTAKQAVFWAVQKLRGALQPLVG